MVAVVAVDVGVDDAVAGEDDEHRALHPDVALHHALAEAPTHRPKPGDRRPGTERRPHSARRPDRGIRRGRRVGVDVHTGRVAGAEVRRLPGRPAADEGQSRAPGLDLRLRAAQLRGLLAAEESAEVAKPGDHRRPVGPEVTGAQPTATHTAAVFAVFVHDTCVIY